MRRPRADPVVGSPSSRMGRPMSRTGMSEIRREREVRIAGSAPDPGLPHRGIGVALSALLAVLLPSCLITQQTHFDEPANSPPAISDGPSPAPSLNAILRPELVAADGGAASVPNQAFEVVVYDADVGQPLQYQVLVDHMPCRSCAGSNGVLPPSSSLTDRVHRSLPFNVGGTLLGTGRCHSVQLLVSGQFVAGGQDPIEAGDIASATWWVLSQDPLAPAVEMRSCP